MKRYVFGTIEGALPEHLVAKGPEDNRIWAAARLDGPTHNAFFALRGPDAAALDAHSAALATAGVTKADDVPVCVTPACLSQLVPISVSPCELEIFYELFAFFHITCHEPIGHLVKSLEVHQGGERALACSTDGHGHFLLEVGLGNPELLSLVHKYLEDAPGVTVTSVHTAKNIFKG